MNNKSEHSIESLATVKLSITGRRKEVYDIVRDFSTKGGLTANEIASRLRRSINTVTARLNELKYMQLVRPAGTVKVLIEGSYYPRTKYVIRQHGEPLNKVPVSKDKQIEALKNLVNQIVTALDNDIQDRPEIVYSDEQAMKYRRLVKNTVHANSYYDIFNL